MENLQNRLFQKKKIRLNWRGIDVSYQTNPKAWWIHREWWKWRVF